MKWKQLLLIVAVSASSAVGSVWMYENLSSPKKAIVQSTNEGKLPVNYAGFFENGTGGAGDPIDFTKAANAAKAAATKGLNPARPPNWGGFRLVPDAWEFWQGRRSRLHDRLRYRLQDANWVRERLAP